MSDQQIISDYIEELKHLNGGYIKSLQNGESEEMDAELEDALKKNEVVIKALKLYSELQKDYALYKRLAGLTMKENDERIAELEIQLAQAEEHICNLERNQT